MGDFLSQKAALDAARIHFPDFLASRKKALTLEAWLEGRQYDHSEELDADDRAYGRAYSPDRNTTAEYENLRSLSPSNFAGLVVKSVTQMCHIEGITRPGTEDSLPIWDTLRRNRWPSKQNAIHWEAVGIGLAYGVVYPGIDPITSEPMARMAGKSATEMLAFYDDPDDEWSRFAIEATKTTIVDERTKFKFSGWNVTLWDAKVMHHLEVTGDGLSEADWKYLSYTEHGLPVPPVVQLGNRVSLSGKASGEIEPILPILRRIDQDLFDRLMMQRFGAWQVRYIAGLAKPDTPEAQAAQSIKLRQEDLLVSTSPDTKFGTLPAASTQDQVNVTDADLRMLSAIAQVPPHHLLGQSSNLQAEALAAATEGLQRKAFEFRLNASEFHEQMARLAAMVEDDMDIARAWDLRVRWRDESSGSMSQAADALGKLAQQLGVPLEMLWERIPGWTDDDVRRAKELVESGAFEKLIQQIVSEQSNPQPDATQQPADQQGDGQPVDEAQQ